MRHIGTQRLETNRLTLRKLLPADAPQMYQGWASDPEVTRWLRWEPHRDAAQTAALLEAWALLYPNDDYYQWAIAETAGGRLVGTISLFYSAQGRDLDAAAWRRPGVEILGGVWQAGYCIGRPWWGRGYATEALRAVTAFWFEQVGGPWLACAHAAANPASGRVMEKAGFTLDHTDIYKKFDGTPVDCRVCVLTRAEYEERNRI